MEKEELCTRLELHRKWINGEPGGERLDQLGLTQMVDDLRGYTLQKAILPGATMWGVNMQEVDMRGIYLRDAHMLCSDLQSADLRGADLMNANFLGVNLFGADLRGANLEGTYMYGSCWPLWYGSFDVKVCKNIAAQLAYHFCKLDCEDPEVIKAQNALIPLANQFNLAYQFGELKPKETDVQSFTPSGAQHMNIKYCSSFNNSRLPDGTGKPDVMKSKSCTVIVHRKSRFTDMSKKG